MGLPTRHRVKNLLPINDTILVSDMNFKERLTSSGIIILGDDATTRGIRPRWGRVYAVGPNQKDVQIGEWILVSHGR